jgi:DNA-binding NarL/FixJ family response regulator
MYCSPAHKQKAYRERKREAARPPLRLVPAGIDDAEQSPAEIGRQIERACLDCLLQAGEAADGREAVAQARRLRPDVVLMDVRMPDVDGIEATRRLLGDDRANAKVVMLTTFDMDEYVYDALRAGASGFLL